MKPSWKTKKAVRKAWFESKRNDEEPMRPASLAPNINPNPKSQKSDAAIRKLTKFLIATLIEFFERTSPLSRAVKPACMKRTSAAQMRSHAISTARTLTTSNNEDKRTLFPLRTGRISRGLGQALEGQCPAHRRQLRDPQRRYVDDGRLASRRAAGNGAGRCAVQKRVSIHAAGRELQPPAWVGRIEPTELHLARRSRLLEGERGTTGPEACTHAARNECLRLAVSGGLQDRLGAAALHFPEGAARRLPGDAREHRAGPVTEPGAAARDRDRRRTRAAQLELAAAEARSPDRAVFAHPGPGVGEVVDDGRVQPCREPRRRCRGLCGEWCRHESSDEAHDCELHRSRSSLISANIIASTHSPSRR